MWEMHAMASTQLLKCVSCMCAGDAIITIKMVIPNIYTFEVYTYPNECI